MKIDPELVLWSSLAIPSALRNLTDLLPWLCSLSMLGRVSTRELAALSLTETWIYGWMSVSWYSVAITQSTLISQAHGARRVGAMRAWAILSFASSFLLAILISGAWLATPLALDSFGFDPALVELAVSYTNAAIPILFLEVFNIGVAIYLTSMQVASLPLAVGLFTALIDTATSYLLIFGAEPELPRLGNALRGAGLGWTIGAVATCIVNVFVLRWALGKELDYGFEGEESGGEGGQGGNLLEEEDWGERQGQGTQGTPLLSDVELKDMRSVVTPSPLRSASLQPAQGSALPQGSAHSPSSLYSPTLVSAQSQGSSQSPLSLNSSTHSRISTAPWRALFSTAHWRVFLTQLLPNVAVVTVSTLQYTLVSILAASLGPTEIATHNCLICLFELVHTATMGMSDATSIRIGSHLGRGDARAARHTAAISFMAAGSWGILFAALGFTFHPYAARIFTNDSAVLAQAATLRSLVWGSYALIAVGDSASGVLEGQGRSGAQAAAAMVGIVVCVPLAFASVHATTFALRGLWGAMFFGYLCVDILCIGFVWFSDWEKLAIEAVKTASNGEEKLPTVSNDEEVEGEEKGAVGDLF